MGTWHAQASDEVAKQLEVSPGEGLSAAEVASRRITYGPNVLKESGGKSPWRLLGEQFTSLLVIMLVVAAFVSAVVLGEWVDGGVIMVVVVLNAALGFSQEFLNIVERPERQLLFVYARQFIHRLLRCAYLWRNVFGQGLLFHQRASASICG